MPFKPQTNCKHRGCPHTVPIGQRYCAEHIKEHSRDRGKDRPNFRQRGYTSNWDKFRRIYLREHPLCAQCGKPALLPHHIIKIAEGGDMYDENNLMPLCFDCHERLHGRKK